MNEGIDNPPKSGPITHDYLSIILFIIIFNI